MSSTRSYGISREISMRRPILSRDDKDLVLLLVWTPATLAVLGVAWVLRKLTRED
jgi:hypothetical protein